MHLEIGFEAYSVAESIAVHGFFNSEPLIVVPAAAERNAWTVVEGNRRLTALLGLAVPAIREQFPDPARWHTLADRAELSLSTRVPVVVHPDRASVTPIVGFRHISGILAWTPYAQARYVAKLIDEDHMTLAEVAHTIGIERTKAGNLYRDQAIAKQARALGFETGPLEESFSLLTVAMSNVQLREHIGAPLGSKLAPGEDPLPPERANELRELLGWVFGHEDVEPLVTDSRQIGRLATVVGSPAGVIALRAGESLEAAHQKSQEAGTDPRQRLMLKLRAARNAATAAKDDLPAYAGDKEVRQAVEEIENASEALTDIIGDA